MTKLDLTKPVQTRDGRLVKIDRTDLKNEKPIAGVVTNNDGCEYVTQWFSSGRRYASCESALDLINVPPKPVKYYINVYRGSDGVIYSGMAREGGPYSVDGSYLIKTIEFEVP